MSDSDPERQGPDVLRIENRIQMFCYYNTLAWEILAATDAVVIVLATLPFVANSEFTKTGYYAAFNYAAAIFLITGGGLVVYRLRRLAARWIQLPWENDRTSPKAWVDYVEVGDWRTSFSPRAKGTNIMLIVILALGVVYIIVSTLFWSRWFP
jgi:hypothetical protein